MMKKRKSSTNRQTRASNRAKKKRKLNQDMYYKGTKRDYNNPDNN